MKNFSMSIALVICSLSAMAQNKLPPVDKSPMDMSYYPNSYPVLKIQDKVSEPLVARVIYSRPQKNGRSVFGELLEYGQVWRLGANEASEIEFFRNVTLAGTRVKKGRYTIYCIPFPDKWTIIINKDTDTWGSFKYDPAKDVLRTDVPVQQNEILESFVMAFEKAPVGASLVIAWDNLKVNIPFTY
jgi:hypothetical protein